MDKEGDDDKEKKRQANAYGIDAEMFRVFIQSKNILYFLAMFEKDIVLPLLNLNCTLIVRCPRCLTRV